MPYKLLIIDDEEDIREALYEALASDYETVTAANGNEALFYVKNHKVDLILTDYNLPDLNGFEILKVIKDISPQTPVIVLSGHGNYEIEQKFLKMGAFQYLEKPCKIDVLKDVLKKASQESL